MSYPGLLPLLMVNVWPCPFLWSVAFVFLKDGFHLSSCSSRTGVPLFCLAVSPLLSHFSFSLFSICTCSSSPWPLLPAFKHAWFHVHLTVQRNAAVQLSCIPCSDNLCSFFFFNSGIPRCILHISHALFSPLSLWVSKLFWLLLSFPPPVPWWPPFCPPLLNLSLL